MVNTADPRKYLGSAHRARTEPIDSKYACVEVVVTWCLFKMFNWLAHDVGTRGNSPPESAVVELGVMSNEFTLEIRYGTA